MKEQRITDKDLENISDDQVDDYISKLFSEIDFTDDEVEEPSDDDDDEVDRYSEERGA